ncbi:MAG TPA: GNAT family N-acetyltransferase [Jiangellaceae bacterium]|nr:GNAT family N-acetyltransferase [Jiangellaceae bacterium]
MRPFELAYGDLRDRLVAAVLRGEKTATTSLHASYLVEDEPLPVTGWYQLIDRDDRPIGVVEVVDVDVRRLGDVDNAIAWAEGEGFSDAADWRRAHEHFWRSSNEVDAVTAAMPGWRLDDDALVVIEHFRWRPDLLVTDRLLLRPFTDADGDAFAAINGDPSVMEHFTTGPLTREQSDGLLSRINAGFETRGFGLSAVERMADGALLGFTGIHHHAWFPNDVEIGWRLAREAWGQGYATEAASAWVGRAFGELALPRLISVTTPGNARSVAVMERLGFTLWDRTTRGGLDLVIYATNAPSPRPPLIMNTLP